MSLETLSDEKSGTDTQMALQDKWHQPTVTAEHFEGVVKTMNAYFDLLYFCDLTLFDRVFHPKAIYATADEQPLLHRTMETYRSVLAQREAPASRQEPRRDAIDDVQFAGENTAFVRARCTIGKTDFVDFLTLVRVQNEWKIMAKIFQIMEKN